VRLPAKRVRGRRKSHDFRYAASPTSPLFRVVTRHSLSGNRATEGPAWFGQPNRGDG
jgi:hypothetical protein